MFKGKEWGTVLRFWSDNLPGVYRRYADGEGLDRQQRLDATAGPTIRGASIVMFVSLFERLVLDLLRSVGKPVNEVSLTDDTWHQALNVPDAWDGWVVLKGMVALRNCFAHEYGRVTHRQHQPVQDFLTALQAGSVCITMLNQGAGGVDKTEKVQAFFHVDANDNVVVDHTAALRFLGMGLLRLFEKAGHDLGL